MEKVMSFLETIRHNGSALKGNASGFFFPLVALVVAGWFFFHGYNGIVKRDTKFLLHRRGPAFQVTGPLAIVLGIVYALFGFVLVAMGVEFFRGLMF